MVAEGVPKSASGKAARAIPLRGDNTVRIVDLYGAQRSGETKMA
jgi:hypothetical protein